MDQVHRRFQDKPKKSKVTLFHTINDTIEMRLKKNMKDTLKKKRLQKGQKMKMKMKVKVKLKGRCR